VGERCGGAGRDEGEGVDDVLHVRVTEKDCVQTTNFGARRIARIPDVTQWLYSEVPPLYLKPLLYRYCRVETYLESVEDLLPNPGLRTILPKYAWSRYIDVVYSVDLKDQRSTQNICDFPDGHQLRLREFYVWGYPNANAGRYGI
jgi:hypothetical protein